jgi:hypothetical protein
MYSATLTSIELQICNLIVSGASGSPFARAAGEASLQPDVGLVAGFLGAEGVFKADATAVDDRHQQDQDIGGLIADVPTRPAGS